MQDSFIKSLSLSQLDNGHMRRKLLGSRHCQRVTMALRKNVWTA